MSINPNVRQRMECVKYMQGKKNYWQGRFCKQEFEKQKDRVRACTPVASYFGDSPQALINEINLIDKCIENWDAYCKFLK